MRTRSLIIALGLLPLFAGCNRSTDQDIAAKPPAELLGSAASSAIDTQPANDGVSLESASNAGTTLILARDVCQISKADFDRLAQYYSGVIGQGKKLQAAFAIGAKTGAAIRVDSEKKGELEQLKSVTCPAVARTLAALPAAKQG